MKVTEEYISSLSMTNEATSFKLAEGGKTFLSTRPLGNLTCIRQVADEMLTLLDDEEVSAV